MISLPAIETAIVVALSHYHKSKNLDKAINKRSKEHVQKITKEDEKKALPKRYRKV